MSDWADDRESPTSPGEAPEPSPVAPGRLTALADGVFAIAMTLLVLELAVPAVAAEDLAEALGEMWAEFLMYALGFMVLGVYWVIHHMIYDSITRYDTTLAWLNIVYLLVAALIPFSTALVVEYGAVTATAFLYGANMLMLFFIGWSMWVYATSRNRLVTSDIDDDLVHGVQRMGFIYFGVLIMALAVAFVSPLASMVVYGGVVLAFVVFTSIGRWQTVAVWNGRSRSNRPV